MTLNQEVNLLKKQIELLKQQILDISKNNEEKTKPYSKIGLDRLMRNQNIVYDGNDGYWKPYAIYKGDE